MCFLFVWKRITLTPSATPCVWGQREKGQLEGRAIREENQQQIEGGHDAG